MNVTYIAGKTLEVAGLMVVAAALLAGMGVLDGNPSMAREILLLGVGGIVFTLGWWLEQSRSR